MSCIPSPAARLLLVCASLLHVAAVASADADPLPSWNDGAPRKALVEFVDAVAREGTPDFVAPSDRVAVFDNDGTLWSEQPMYFQLAFAIDRVKDLAPEHPEWKGQEPFASLLRGDVRSALAGGERAILEIVSATHAGSTPAEFEATVSRWIETARHPKTGRRYTEMIYQPMLELLDYLRAHGFKTYIVSGGGVAFMRAWAESVYGIPPEQVVGSRIGLRFDTGERKLVRGEEIEFIDDRAAKPVAIQQRIGRRPILAFGNSDGDLQMLQWTVEGDGPRLAGLVHHTDARREWAYDRDSSIGRLDAALDEALVKGWVVVDMAKDWKQIHPPVGP